MSTTNRTRATASRKSSPFGLRISFLHLLSCLFGGMVATFALSMFHGSLMQMEHDLEHFAEEHLKSVNNQQPILINHVKTKSEPMKIGIPDQQDHNHHHHHSVAGLDCTTHGGPTDPIASQELVYWKDLPLDTQYVSPFKVAGERQYLTFEPDGGGWNNIRMSMETVLGMAIATGRVLVLPPSQHMYLLKDKTFSFADFFPLEAIAKEQDGLEIITMKQFLEETKGKLKDSKTGQPASISNDRVDWDGDTKGVKSILNPFLQSIAENPDWDPTKCLAAFPASKDPKDIEELKRIHEKVVTKIQPKIEQFVNVPTPVNATTEDRMAEFVAERRDICIYDTKLQQAPIIHFHGKKTLGARLLVHFYAFIFFQNYEQDIWLKRFVRDHVRYIDDVQCAASRVIEAVRKHSNEHGNNGIYDSFHIRRGDFQYKKTRVEASEIITQAKDQIPKGTTIYVGTDERRKDFFKAMKDYGWDVLFLDDFMHLLEGVDKNYYGMIDQLVDSKGRTFFGCWFSTFTGYITRLRGYHSQNTESEGYEMGLLPHSFYYALPEHKTKMHDYWPIKKAFYPREFPSSWRNLDFDIDLHGDEANH